MKASSDSRSGEQIFRRTERSRTTRALTEESGRRRGPSCQGDPIASPTLPSWPAV